MADPSESFGPLEGSNVATEDQYARWVRSMGITDGCIASTRSFDPPDLKVTANGGTNVSIAAGEANVGGFWYRNALAVTRPIPANAGSTPRLDAVVLRLDTALDEVSIKYVKGTSILPPLLQNFGTQWDVRLATVTVPAGASTVASSGVADRRQFVTPGQLNMNTNLSYPTAYPGQIMVRPGNRIILGQEDGSWQQVLPLGDPTWIPFDYTSNIRDYNAGDGSGYYNGAYAKFADGTVRLRGLVEVITGTVPANTVIARLPEGFRPGATMVYNAYGNSGAMRITINGDDNATDSGKIRIAAGLGVNGWVSMDGITWWSAQA